MKNTYLSLFLFFSVFGFSQFNPNSPWKKQSPDAKNSTFKNDVDAFNEYWKTHAEVRKEAAINPLKDGKTNMKIS